MTQQNSKRKKRPLSYISQRLALYRERLNLTQQQVADRLSVSVNTYAALENHSPKDEERLLDRLMTSEGERPFQRVGNAEFQQLKHEQFRHRLAAAFGVSPSDFDDHVGLPSETDMEYEEEAGDVTDPGAWLAGRWVPVSPQFPVHSVASLQLLMVGKEHLAESRSLGLVRPPADLQMEEGSFIYNWTDEFDDVPGAPRLGELLFIATGKEAVRLETLRLYVIVDRGEVLLRRAVRDDHGKWWLISGHWNRKRHRSLSVTTSDRRIYGRAVPFRHMIRDYLRASEPGEEHV